MYYIHAIYKFDPMTFWKRQNYGHDKMVSDCQGSWKGTEDSLDCSGTMKLFCINPAILVSKLDT